MRQFLKQLRGAAFNDRCLPVDNEILAKTPFVGVLGLERNSDARFTPHVSKLALIKECPDDEFFSIQAHPGAGDVGSSAPSHRRKMT